MSLKNKINSENPLIDFKGLNEYHSKMSALQEANTNKIAQIVGELAGATAQLSKTTTKVNCDHRYEITGNTGDEHNLAIEDQQMLINKIQGRTLVKNQLFSFNLYSDTESNGVLFTKGNNGEFIANGTATSLSIPFGSRTIPIIANHKYCVLGCPNGGNSYTYKVLCSPLGVTPNTEDVGNGAFFTALEDDIVYLSPLIAEGTTVNNLVFKPQLIDLTLAYQINKPTTVKEVLKDFPEYIPYDEGTFVHSNNKLVSTGRNLWDEEWEQGWIDGNGNNANSNANFRSKNYISCLPNTEYYVKTDSASIAFRFYDNNKKLVSISGVTANKKITTPTNAYFMRFFSSPDGQSIYNNDICINVSDINFNGTYEPYKEEVVEVGELKEFDYIDNDSDEKEIGTGLIDLGDLDFKYLDYSIFFAEVPNLKQPSSHDDRNKGILSTKYPSSENITIDNNMDNRAMLRYMNSIYIRDSLYTDVTTFKEAMKGVMLAYELVTPIVEPSNLPAGMSVYKGGYQIQEGTIPYVIKKQYALSIVSQVLQNIEIDREQQEQIDNMKGDIAHKQPLLFSGQNIKTFNGKPILGSGDLAWNDPMFLAKFNNVTNYTKENGGVIDEVLEGKTYRIYSDNDVSSSIYSFDVRLKLKISSGETKMYTIALPTKTKNFIDFRLDNIVLNGQRATLYYNVDNVDYTQLLTQQGDAVTGDYEMYGWGALYLSGTYAAVFEPVELLTKEDLNIVQPVKYVKDILYIGTEHTIELSCHPIVTKHIFMKNTSTNDTYYLFFDLSSGSIISYKNGQNTPASDLFDSLDITDINKDITFAPSEARLGDIIEAVYETGYIDPKISIEM